MTDNELLKSKLIQLVMLSNVKERKVKTNYDREWSIMGRTTYQKQHRGDNNAN